MRLPESAMLLGLGVQPSARLAFVVLLRQVPHRTREVRPEAVLGCLHELPRKDRRQVQRGRRGHLLHVRYLETFGTPLALAVLHAACSASDRIPSHGDGGASSGGAAGADASPGPCGHLMVLSGSVCVDKQPALHADGSQGAAVSWDRGRDDLRGAGREAVHGSRAGGGVSGWAGDVRGRQPSILLRSIEHVGMVDFDYVCRRAMCLALLQFGALPVPMHETSD